MHLPFVIETPGKVNAQKLMKLLVDVSDADWPSKKKSKAVKTGGVS